MMTMMTPEEENANLKEYIAILQKQRSEFQNQAIELEVEVAKLKEDLWTLRHIRHFDAEGHILDLQKERDGLLAIIKELMEDKYDLPKP